MGLKMEVKEKVLEKIKEKALAWHAGRNVQEKDAGGQELKMIKEIKKTIVESSLNNKAILLITIKTLKDKLEKKENPETLPIFVKNLAKKPEIREKILEITKKYNVSGLSYYDLWDLK